MATTFERIRQVFVDNMGVSPEEVLESSSIDSLGGDSLDAIEILLSLEGEFDLMDIPDEDAIKLTTVADIVKYVDEQLAKRVTDPVTEEL